MSGTVILSRRTKHSWTLRKFNRAIIRWLTTISSSGLRLSDTAQKRNVVKTMFSRHKNQMNDAVRQRANHRQTMMLTRGRNRMTTRRPGDKPAASTVPTKAKQWLKLGSFAGRTEVEAFIKRFTMSARNHGWDDYEKLSHLSCALKPPADQLLWEAGADDVTTWS